MTNGNENSKLIVIIHGERLRHKDKFRLLGHISSIITQQGKEEEEGEKVIICMLKIRAT